MFCTFFGDALYCHKCLNKVSMQTSCKFRGHSEGQQQQTSATACRGLSIYLSQSFAQRRRKNLLISLNPEVQASAKKYKAGLERPVKDIKIDIVILAMKDGTLKRGRALPLTVSPNI